MTLTNRVSIFFLAALAAVLLVFSIAVYALASIFLWRQADQQLMSTFQTLVAAVELEHDDVKFEPSDHTIATVSASSVAPLHWLIRDEAGLTIASSHAFGDDRPLKHILAALPESQREDILAPKQEQALLIVQRTLVAPHPKPASERDPLEREAITVTVIADTVAIQHQLRWLALLMGGLCLVCWAITAVLGHVYCQRALRPVGQMARDARAITPADSTKRLAAPRSGDELEDLGLAFNSLLDRLHGALEREQRFTGDAAHQLRTPVTVLLGQIEVAQRRERSTAEYRQLLAVLQQQTQELRQMIESLLFLARGGVAETAQLEALQLAPWLEAHLARWTDHARGSDLQIAISPAERRYVRAQPILLGQLLDNLIENAFKYTPAGTPVRIVLGSDLAQATIVVEDHGPGIAPDELSHIFTPFYRSPDARQAGVPGTGLGLSVAARIAELLGGKLSVDLAEHHGCRFTTRLPWLTSP